jgi:hypothetical protein
MSTASTTLCSRRTFRQIGVGLLVLVSLAAGLGSAKASAGVTTAPSASSPQPPAARTHRLPRAPRHRHAVRHSTRARAASTDNIYLDGVLVNAAGATANVCNWTATAGASIRPTAYVFYPKGIWARAWMHDRYDASGHEKWVGPTAWFELNYNYHLGVTWNFTGVRKPNLTYVEFAHLSATGWHYKYDTENVIPDWDTYQACSDDFTVQSLGWSLDL